jgi:phosphoribosylglycinamide formyltransferase-1
MVKIAVLVSGSGTNLQALIDAERGGLIKNGRISLVLSSSADAYALERAAAAGIESCVVPRKKYKDRLAFTEAVLSELRKRDIGLVVLAGFLYVLSPVFTQVYENRVINVHPSLIPAFCGDGYYGLRVHERVLEYGVKVTGATVHFANEETDGGPIILQKAVEVSDDDTPETLRKRVMREAEWVILPRAVSLFCEGRLKVEGRHVSILGPDENL